MVIKEIAEGIKLIADVVSGTQAIVKAVNDGREYLKRYYPDAQRDVAALLRQMQHAVVGLEKATRIISSFRFVVSPGNLDLPTAKRDMARLNHYLRDQRTDIATLRGRIRDLKADCHKVGLLRDKLDARAKSSSMFELFGSKSRKRALELSGNLSNFYADDQRMIDVLEQSLRLTEAALDDVENSLGPPGIADPYNVPVSAQVLGLYAQLFKGPRDQIHALAAQLGDARLALLP